MKTKELLIAAAVTGALAAFPLSVQAGDKTTGSSAKAGKAGCSGKAEQKKDKKKDKSSCQGKAKQGKEKKKEKAACAGKDGCSGKDKQS